MRPSGESLDIGIGHTRAPLDHPILGQRHLPLLRFLDDLRHQSLLLIDGVVVPGGEVHVLPAFDSIALDQP
jgi:hypothetical protein